MIPLHTPSSLHIYPPLRATATRDGVPSHGQGTVLFLSLRLCTSTLITLRATLALMKLQTIATVTRSFSAVRAYSLRLHQNIREASLV